MRKTIILITMFFLIACEQSGTPAQEKENVFAPNEEVEGPENVTQYWATMDESDSRKQVGGLVETICTNKSCKINLVTYQSSYNAQYYYDYSFYGEITFEGKGSIGGYYYIGMIPVGKKEAKFSLILNEQLEPVQIRNNSYCVVYTMISNDRTGYDQMTSGKIGISDSRTLDHVKAMHVSDPSCDL